MRCQMLKCQAQIPLKDKILTMTCNGTLIGKKNLEASAMSQYIAFLTEKGLQLNGFTPSDGNCFFWAVSKQISTTTSWT